MAESSRANSISSKAPSVADALPRPDFYIAAIGRSGSTMLSNWLSRPPERIVFMEPFFLRAANSRLLQIQLANLGMQITEEEWATSDATPLDRFRRLMGPRLSGRRWAAKEVLCEEHEAMTRTFAPPRVLVSVRDIEDVALSFFEKHRLQDNLDRFGDDWVADYCRRETAGLLAYLAGLDEAGVPYRIVRYEDFTASEQERRALCEFVGWPGGGDVAANLDDFGRGFEVDHHGTQVASSGRPRETRSLAPEVVASAAMIAEACANYQRRFGFR